MDRGAWLATVHGITRVGHYLATKPPPETVYFMKKKIMTTTHITEIAIYVELQFKKSKSESSHPDNPQQLWILRMPETLQTHIN